MNLSMLFYLAIILFAVIVLYALSRYRDVKAMCKIPFVSFSFEAKESGTNRLKNKEKIKRLSLADSTKESRPIKRGGTSS